MVVGSKGPWCVLPSLSLLAPSPALWPCWSCGLAAACRPSAHSLPCLASFTHSSCFPVEIRLIRRSHTAVGIGNNLLDAHNVARFHVAGSFYQINAIWNPVLVTGLFVCFVPVSCSSCPALFCVVRLVLLPICRMCSWHACFFSCLVAALSPSRAQPDLTSLSCRLVLQPNWEGEAVADPEGDKLWNRAPKCVTFVLILLPSKAAHLHFVRVHSDPLLTSPWLFAA